MTRTFRPTRFVLCAPTTLLFLLLTARPAAALSVQDILDLSRAGVSEEVIVALIEASDERFALDATQILELRTAGVSDRVLVAMLRSGRRFERSTLERADAERPEAAPPPTGVLLGHGHTGCAHRRVALIPVPVVVARAPRRSGHVDAAAVSETGFGTLPPALSGFGALPPRTPVATSPAAATPFWGWGGTRRPGAWGQPREPASSPPR